MANNTIATKNIIPIDEGMSTKKAVALLCGVVALLGVSFAGEKLIEEPGDCIAVASQGSFDVNPLQCINDVFGTELGQIMEAKTPKMCVDYCAIFPELIEIAEAVEQKGRVKVPQGTRLVRGNINIHCRGVKKPPGLCPGVVKVPITNDENVILQQTLYKLLEFLV